MRGAGIIPTLEQLATSEELVDSNHIPANAHFTKGKRSVTPRGVVVVHQQAMVAEGIAAALARFPGIVPIAVTTDPAEAERLGQRADAVAIDQGLEGADDSATRLRRKGVRVVFIGGELEGDEGIQVSLEAPVATLAAALVPGTRNGNGASNGKSLTNREREVLGLVARGMAAKQVARHLGISPKTVERHKGHIFAKLGVSNQAAAVHVGMAGEMRGAQ
jgi:DNA-binding NarL/FixJ family response regulator